MENSQAENAVPSCSAPNEVAVANQDPVNDALITEIKKYKAYQEAIISNIKECKRNLLQHENIVSQQTEKIQEIEESVAATSKKLELEVYDRWKNSADLSDLRSICEKINEYNEKSDDILNQCEKSNVVYKQYVTNLENVLGDCVSKSNKQLQDQDDLIRELRAGVERDEQLFARDAELMREANENYDDKLRTEQQKLQDLKKELSDLSKQAVDYETEYDAITTRNNELLNELILKRGLKRSILDAREETERLYNTKIEELKILLDDHIKELALVTEENETVAKALADQDKINEDILRENEVYTDQINDYIQKCSEIDAEANEIDASFAEESAKAEGQMQLLAAMLDNAKQELVREKELKTKAEEELIALTEKLQHELSEVANLQSESDALEELNENKRAKLREQQISIDSIMTGIMDMNNQVLDVTKKLNEKETKMSVSVSEVECEIRKLENELRTLEEAGPVDLEKIREEKSEYERKARDDLLKLETENDNAVDEHNKRLEEIKAERDGLVIKIKEAENVSESLTLESEVLVKKLQEVSKNQEQKKSEAPPAYRKRTVDEMSDSSTDGLPSVQERIKMQRAAKAHRMMHSNTPKR